MNQGQVAVSIHVNAIADPSVHGAVVFYARGSEQGKLLAEKVLAELGKVQHLNHSFVVPREKHLRPAEHVGAHHLGGAGIYLQCRG